jgi:hypothetical protein
MINLPSTASHTPLPVAWPLVFAVPPAGRICSNSLAGLLPRRGLLRLFAAAARGSSFEARAGTSGIVPGLEFQACWDGGFGSGSADRVGRFVEEIGFALLVAVRHDGLWRALRPSKRWRRWAEGLEEERKELLEGG